MNKFYFTVGEFCAEGMGSGYFGYGAKFLIVSADTYSNAYNQVMEYAEGIFGKQEYKDMWYGEMAYNWKVTPCTFDSFKRQYKERFNILTYHTNRAKLIFNGEQLTTQEFDEHVSEFLKNYPILEITGDKIEAFNGNIFDMLPIKNDKVKFPDVVEGAENIIVTETEIDKEFFNE